MFCNLMRFRLYKRGMEEAILRLIQLTGCYKIKFAVKKRRPISDGVHGEMAERSKALASKASGPVMAP